MPWKKGERIPTNLFVGFLGSGKTSAISKLVQKRPVGEDWSIFVNEFGKVSIDHALIDSCAKGVAIEELGGGCACCTMSFVFKPLLAQFIRRSKPDRLILEPSGISHPAKVVDILRSEGFANAIDLRNIICLIDPKDLDEPKWQQSDVFQDQVQLADIVVINWTDARDREQIDRCRAWVESFDPPKQLVLESSFGVIDAQLLDMEFETIRVPLFGNAHPVPIAQGNELPVVSADHLDDRAKGRRGAGEVVEPSIGEAFRRKPTPRNPCRFQNDDSQFHACGWIFHVDDLFDRSKLIDFLSDMSSIARLKGVFRCKGNWWSINRAKDVIDVAVSTYRRDSRLEVILNSDSCDWESFESQLLQCLFE